MHDHRQIGVGLLGLGVVGSEVARNLIQNSERMTRQAGLSVALKGVLVRDGAKARDPIVPANLVTTNPGDILENPDIDLVVELIGGERPAVDLLRDALTRDKHAVTANKQVMATHGPELVRLAQEHRVNLMYEASVGGGIPIIGPLHHGLFANDVTSIRAIINGTTNYILTQMARDGTSFEEALRQAQDLGYAEADPSSDVEGTDAAFKLAILSSLAFHTEVVGGDVHREGISRLSAGDFQYADELGYAIKLLATASRSGDSLSLRVNPALVPQEQLLAKVDGVFNAVEIEGDLVGRVVFHGQGAGPRPTSSAVLGDILEIARSIASDRKPANGGTVDRGLRILPIGELETQYYARLTVTDEASVLAKIATVLGDLEISIASVIQKNADPASQTAVIVIMTHPSKEAHVRRATQELEALGVVKEVSNIIRVERWA
ncbi:MAG: homoserine dehydrogenase [Dehalococcoidia bacterium]|nr:homoserine dehydrogenase [Dehalococcoidia bacterium]